MAAVLTEPEVTKAVTADLVHFSFPIEKSEDTKTVNPVDGTPDIEIWGKVTDGTLDSDLQVVDPDASLRWIKTWYDTKANIRMGHDPRRPVGRGLEIDGHYVKALIAEPVAKHLIRNRVLNDWSVGIMNPDVRKGDPRFRHLDPQGKAVNGVITDRADGITGLGEISVVDRGSNYGTAFQLMKSAADGSPEWTGTLTAPDDVIEKYATPSLTKANGKPRLTSVDLPSDMKLKVTPAVLAKMATLKRELVLQEQALKAEPAGVISKADLSDSERAGMPASDFAYVDSAGGRHLPVHDEGHVRSALGRFAQQSFESPAARKKAARKIVSRARGLGIDLEPHGRVVSAASGGAKVAKAAEPDIAKCAKCDGSQMVDGKPCPDCKPSKAQKRQLRKALRALDEFATAVNEPAIGKKKGKMRALCPNCGAKQNPAHAHCPECGRPLPPNAIQVAKNHDFVCLGCGADLDKGEPHCPNCGKDNPGYLPEADRKIPANEDADKSAGKDRVAKASKKSGKKGKEPFGDAKAPPFGKEAGGDGDDKPGTAEKRRKGGKKGGKGRSPAEGVKGQETTGLPPHREPVPPATADFERDAAMGKGAGEDLAMAAALRHKSLGVEPHLAVLHDLTCPAYSPASVEKALPHASFAAIDTQYWATKALEAASGSDMATAMRDYNALQVLSQAAVTLKTADPGALHRIRAAGHEAFLEANKDALKAFRDATPGPGSAPTPASYVQPGTFRRPYLSDGHAAASPQYEPARTFPVITDHPQAQDFGRGYLSAGHGSQSPDNTGSPGPMPAGPAGAPQSRAAAADGMQARDYDAAVSTMHDHLSRIAPGICPMSPEMGRTQKPAPPVPAAVGAPVASRGKTAKAARAAQKAKSAAKAARTAKRKAAAQKRRVQGALLKGKITPDEARAKLGLAPVTKAAVPFPAAAETEPAAAQDALTPEVLARAVKAAVGPLVKRQNAQDKALRKNKKVLDAIAGQPDTTNAPFRGAGIAKQASAGPAAPRTAAEAAALAQTANITRLQKQWRDSYNPAEREAAWRELTAQLGINPMTGTPDTSHPFRT